MKTRLKNRIKSIYNILISGLFVVVLLMCTASAQGTGYGLYGSVLGGYLSDTTAEEDLDKILQGVKKQLAESGDSLSDKAKNGADLEIDLDPEALAAMAGIDSTTLDSLSRDGRLLDSMLEADRDSTEKDTVPNYGDKQFLDAPIFLDFTDSLVYIPSTRDVYMHKEGKITYAAQELSADYIKLNTDTKLVAAEGVVTDTVTLERSQVAFIDGEADYQMDSMTYNLDSGKALIYGVKTVEGEGIMYGGTVKKMKDNVTHMHAGRYTTCDAECPHFYLQMTKATVVPNKVTVFGPAYMVFEDVPLYPLTIPFGFFPQKDERNSGIIIPSIGEENT